jgi:hypothetical protein
MYCRGCDTNGVTIIDKPFVGFVCEKCGSPEYERDKPISLSEVGFRIKDRLGTERHHFKTFPVYERPDGSLYTHAFFGYGKYFHVGRTLCKPKRGYAPDSPERKVTIEGEPIFVVVGLLERMDWIVKKVSE